MKVKVLNTDKIIDVDLTIFDEYQNYAKVIFVDQSGKTYQYNEVELLYDSADEKQILEISGWIARDKDNKLRLHYTKPERQSGCYWQGDFKSTYLPDNIMPSIDWDSAPVKVKLKITPDYE